MTSHIQTHCGSVDLIVGLEARGFVFGPMIAQKLHKPFVPVRKAGKLPGETTRVTYQLEYGEVGEVCGNKIKMFFFWFFDERNDISQLSVWAGMCESH